ncbi:hypothetical protein ACOSQ3_009294 [Xanthoceras sorbifolium]
MIFDYRSDISLQLIVKPDDPDAEPKFLALLTDNKRKWRTNLAAHVQKQSRSILQTHSGIGQETDLTALYLEPFHDCIAECLPSLLLKRKYSRSIY